MNAEPIKDNKAAVAVKAAIATSTVDACPMEKCRQDWLGWEYVERVHWADGRSEETY
jgi:hypothetical protein